MGYEIIDKAFKRYGSGREVCLKTSAGMREYRKRREFMYYRDNRLCCLCGKEILCLEEATFEHTGSRGMGGSKRDDRVKFNGCAHLRCNQLKGSMSMEQFRKRFHLSEVPSQSDQDGHAKEEQASREDVPWTWFRNFVS